MTDIIIKRGTFGKKQVVHQEAVMTLTPRTGTRGMYVTVQGTPFNLDRNVRVLIDSEDDINMLGFDAQPEPQADVPVLSDNEIMDNMRERFSVLDDMAHAALEGIVRGLIVTGPPGIGKSFGVEAILDQAECLRKVGEGDYNIGIEKGSARPVGLYMLLHSYAKKGSVLVLDDSDTILYDEASLNLLKAATDSSSKRRLSWRSESNALSSAGIPNTFTFHGSIIFITNLDFEKSRGKVGAHLGAIMSRCHYLDMGITGTHEKFLRCKQIVADGMLRKYDFTPEAQDEILDFIQSNQSNLRELSLRMVSKIADLRKMNGKSWKKYATATCLRG